MEIDLSDAGDPRECVFQYCMALWACYPSEHERNSLIRRIEERGKADDFPGEYEPKEDVFAHQDL